MMLEREKDFPLGEPAGPVTELGRPVLEVRNLSVSFASPAGSVHALRSVSFAIGRGETLALVGESGSGKSTAALAVLHYLPKGAVQKVESLRVMGDELSGLSSAALRLLRGNRVSAVSQNPSTALNPAMTVGAQIAEVLRYHRGLSRKAARMRAEELLDEVQIRDPATVFDRYPHELSGGMQQRVAIAIAIALEPELIVLDEPTTALDVTVQRQILELLSALQARRGTSYLLISHDIHLVGAFADRIAVMRDGEIVETGTWESLRRRPAHDYTRTLLASATVESAARAVPVATAPLLQVMGVSHRFRAADRPVVKDISLSLLPGQTLGLIGESGSGKSTIGKLICGIHDVGQGSMALAGEPLPAQGARRSLLQRNLVRMVFQSPDATLNPSHRIGSLLRRAAEIAGAPDPTARMRALLDQVRLAPEIAERFPSQLSGGQKQRVAIARAFASSPRVVVLDEPTSALDATVQKEVLALLRDLQAREGVAYLLITHDLGLLSGTADEVMVLQGGEVVERGSTAQLLANPRHDYTRSLLESGRVGREAFLA